MEATELSEQRDYEQSSTIAACQVAQIRGRSMLTAHWSQEVDGCLDLLPKIDSFGWWAGAGGRGSGHQDFKSTPGIFNMQPSLRTTDLEEVEVEGPVTLL